MTCTNLSVGKERQQLPALIFEYGDLGTYVNIISFVEYVQF